MFVPDRNCLPRVVPRSPTEHDDAMNDAPAPFDRHAVQRHRNAVARRRQAEFLFREVGGRLIDRLDDITHHFPVVCELGARDGWLRSGLLDCKATGFLVQSDLSPAFAARLEGPRLAADEEFLPFARESLDAVISNLVLHWVNDLVGTLIQIRMALRPDGLFLASLLGGETLVELRSVLAEAEIAVTGGLSARLSPMVDIRDAGALLQRAGFALPVADTDRIDVTYADALALMRDLKAMGENNALHDRSRNFARKDVFLAAASLYQQRHADSEGRIRTTFDVIYLTAWAPDDTQQKPLRPGSGRVSLTEVL